MKTQFDPESNILILSVGTGDISSAKEKNGIIIHVTSSNVPVLIEILNVSNLISKFTKIAETSGTIKPAPTPT